MGSAGDDGESEKKHRSLDAGEKGPLVLAIVDEKASSGAHSSAHFVLDEARPARPDVANLGEISQGEVFEISSDDSVDELPETFSEKASTTNIVSTEPTLMAPPATPSRRPPHLPDLFEDQPGSPDPSGSQATSTPRLHPLPSPGLPLVPPLIQRHGVATSYFPEFTDPISELDASGVRSQAEISDVVQVEDFNFQLSMPLGSPGLQRETAFGASRSNLEGHDRQDMEPSNAQASRDSSDHGQIESPLVSSNLITASTTIMDAVDQPRRTSLSIDMPTSDWIHSFPELEAQVVPLDDAPDVIEDEDMYGPSSPLVIANESDLTPSSPKPMTVSLEEDPESFVDDVEQSPTMSTQASADWQRRLSISAIDTQTHRVMSPPPFPFVQHWERASSGSRRSSTYPRSFDGTSDAIAKDDATSQGSDLKEPESIVGSVVDDEDVLSPKAERDSQPDPALDSTLNPELRAEEAEEAEEAVGVVLSSAESRSPPLLPAMILEEDVLAVEDPIVELQEKVPAVEEPALELDEVRRAPSEELELMAPPIGVEHHLLTPANTQREVLEENGKREPQQMQEHAVPPTPENTQEQLKSHLPVPAPEEAERERLASPITEGALKPSLRSSPISRRTSQRLSRKSVPLETLPAISSPYFTPRSSERMPALPSLTPTRKENIPPTNLGSTPDAVKTVGKSEPEGQLEVTSDTTDARQVPPLVTRPSGLLTPLSYFTPLAAISDHFFQNIDVLAICPSASTDPQRAKFGPKDSQCTLKLVDSTLQENDVVITQIFRPSKFALPTTRRGDVVLLRNMKVQSQKRKCFLLSVESSAWAVFAHPEHSYNSASMLGVTNAGPPVEYGPEERSRAVELMQWWDEEGVKRFPQPDKQNATKVDLISDPKGKTDLVATEPHNTRSSRRQANLTDHIGNGGEDYIPVSPELPYLPPSRRMSDVSILSQPAQRTKRSSARNRKSESVIHELRDGTTWVDGDDGEEESVIHELRDGVTWIDE